MDYSWLFLADVPFTPHNLTPTYPMARELVKRDMHIPEEIEHE